jgi:hypothetical protein
LATAGVVPINRTPMAIKDSRLIMFDLVVFPDEDQRMLKTAVPTGRQFAAEWQWNKERTILLRVTSLAFRTALKEPKSWRI